MAHRSRLNKPELADTRFLGAQFIHKLTLGNQKPGRRERGIMRLRSRHAKGLGNVNALAVNMHVRLTRTGKHGARAGRNGTRRQVGPNVKAEDAICLITLKNAALAHRLGATRGLLRRLEHKENIAFKLAWMLMHNAIDIDRRRKGHGHMGIVPASMHLARVRRGKARPRRLFYRKRIHIGTNRRGGGGIGARIEKCANARIARMRHFAGKPSEYTLDIRHGLFQIEPKFRNTMQIPAIAHHLRKFNVAVSVVRIHWCPPTRSIARHYRAAGPYPSIEQLFRASISNEYHCRFTPCFAMIFMIRLQNSIEERAR